MSMRILRSAAIMLLTAAVLLLSGVEALSAQVQGQWAATGTMQSARKFDAQVRMNNGKVLAIGGVNNSGNILASSEVYSPALGTWKLTGRMAEAREQFPAIVLTSGKVLVSGGLGAGSTVLASAELYDSSTGSWSSAGSLSVARFGHTATLLLPSGKVLVAGGCTASNCGTDTAVSELYDPTTNSWSKTGRMNTARYSHSAVRLKSGKVLAIGGHSGSSATTSCELYDPSKDTWSNAASTHVARYLHATTLLPDGKVLVTGGAIFRYPSSTAELYAPSANTWTLTGNMTTGRYAHTATLLTDGEVVVAGGEGQAISCGKACTSYIPTAKVEIYNEAAGKSTAAASLSRARAYHSATLLGNGRVLADGGIGYTSVCCVVLSSAEVYTPLTLTFSATRLNFGVLQIGLTSASQTVTVSNVSSHSATFTSIASSGDFPESNTCPTTLSAGQKCTITVSFKPTAAGTRNGAVTLKDNCPGSPIQTIALTGIGAANAMTLLPASLSFPGQTPASSSAPQSITLYNDGAAAVNIKGIAISPNNRVFTQTNNCPSTLKSNTHCVIQVVFTPPDAGNYSATLSVTDSDKSSPQTAALSGIGLNN
jgi:N-acetylneuraminic acid mutarotase